MEEKKIVHVEKKSSKWSSAVNYGQTKTKAVSGMIRQAAWVLILITISIFILSQPDSATADTTAKYVIVMIGDGMGPEHVKVARNFNGGPLAFEGLAQHTTMTTYAANDPVTDSAASATAMAAGQKVNNGVISIATPGDGSELETLLETYKADGKSVGLVTTTYMTHATPAAFGAHNASRNNTSDIGSDYISQTMPNVLFGGGGNGMSTSSAASAGYTVVSDRTAMQALNTESETFVSGQFGSSHLPYEYDQSYATLPHLHEMTQSALAILDNNTSDGFFLMVEGGRIDHAAHDNNINRNIDETLEFGETVQDVIDWIEADNDSSWSNTILLVTADHETGGLTVLNNPGQGVYPSDSGSDPDVTWLHGSHTDADVDVFAQGVGASQISAPNMDNTNVYDYLKPAALPVQTVQFAVIGDFGDASQAEADVAGMINGWSPDLVITTGDNRYGNTTYENTVGQFFCDFLTDVGSGTNCTSGGNSPTNAFFPSLGNHDYTDGGGLTQYLNYFSNLPGTGIPTTGTSGIDNRRYYDFIQGPVHFFVIDSQGALTSSSDMTAQQDWLQTQLDDSTTPWQVVYFHHAAYSSSTNHGSTPEMQWPFALWGADAIFQGHDHTYERIIVDNIPYFVSGNGGRSLYGCGSPIAGSSGCLNGDYGAMLVTATDSNINFKSYYRTGALVDEYDLDDPGGSGTTISFQEGVAPDSGYDGATDVTIAEGAPLTNDGGNASCYIDGDDGGGDDLSTLFRWDVSAIPAGSNIEQASITLNVFNVSPNTYELFRVLRDWVENEATWNIYSSGNNWQTPGALGALDRGSDILGAFTPANSGFQTIQLNADGIALVQSWVDDPSTNGGIILADSGATDGADFDCSETGSAANRPKLSLTYSGGSSPINPTADAGPDQTVVDSDGNNFETVTLDGSGSTDLDGTIVSYDWTEGATSLGSGATLAASFGVGAHTVTLTVTDDAGLTGTDDVIITVDPQPNQDPIANAGPDQTVVDGDGNNFETITLDGSGSTDLDGTLVSYDWTEGATSLGSGAILAASFGVGSHTVTLTVTDNDGATDTDDVIITINPQPAQPPTADAGPDQTVVDSDGNNFETVTLDGSGSSDGDGSIISYDWAEGATSLGSGETLATSFGVGAHTVTLTVTDNDGATDTDDVIITVNPQPNQAPTANAGPDQTVVDNDGSGSEPVTLDGSGSSDSDGTIVSYAWTEGATSLGSGATLATSFGVGAHTVTLTVTDNDGAVDADDVLITINPPPATDPKLQVGTVSGVGNSGWTTVSLPDTYTSMVVVATANYDDGDAPAAVRIRNAAGSSFEVRADSVNGSDIISDVTVHYTVVEEGVYTEATSGVKMEAVKFNSTVTDYRGSWVGESRTYSNVYANPVVVGQVMTYNDSAWSIFWTHGINAYTPPNSAVFYAGKMVGEDTNTTRAEETIGYIVIESGKGSVGGFEYTAALGTDTIAGIDDNPPYTYGIGGLEPAQVAVVSQSAMDGNNGGWAILYGANPLSNTSLALAIDEDQIRDTERKHTKEQVAYIVFGTAVQTGSSDVIYVSSTSGGSIDGESFSDEDIMAYDTGTSSWFMYFDGSDVGLSSSVYQDIDAFYLMDDGSLLLSFLGATTIPNVGQVDDSDIVRFVGSFGTHTSGTFEWYFEGSDVQLSSSSEDIDAIGFAPDGRLLISTTGSPTVNGVSTAGDEDLLAFTGTLGSSSTSGTWALYLDGSDVGLNDASSEDINGVYVNAGSSDIYVTSNGSYSVTGLSGDGDDIFRCTPGSFDPTTSCTFSLYWDGDAHGYGSENMDGLMIVP